MTPSSEQHSCTEPFQLPVCNITPIGEQYQADVTVHELPGEHSSGINDIIAFKARTEYLEAENAFLTLQNEKESSKHSPFRIEQIQHDDCLVHFCTGFETFQILSYFFESFLGLSLINSTTEAQRRESNLIIIIGSCHPLIFSF